MRKIIKLFFLCILIFAFEGCKNAERRKINKIDKMQFDNQDETSIKILNFEELQNNRYIIGTDIKIKFDKELDSEDINAEHVRLIRVDTNESIELKLNYEKPYLIIHPMDRFVTKGRTVIFKGIKPDTEYVLEFDTDEIEGLGEAKLAPLFSELLIKSEELNYGIYWFGRDGYCQKYVEGVENRYYDPQKSVVLHSHGWQVEKTPNDYWIDQPYIVNNRFYKNEVANNWKDADYNIGAWLWGQFADELDVRDAEAKIWVGANELKNMRYRMKDRAYFEFATEKSIHELLYEEYIGALSEFEGSEIRFTGHSLGNQVVTALAGKLEYEADIGAISDKYIPSRITLLDPFWSNFDKDYLAGMWTGELCAQIIESLVTTKGVVVDEVKSSEIGNTVSGDNNAELRKLTAFIRVWSSKIPILDLEARHTYSTDWYFRSISSDVIIDDKKIGAKASSEEIRDAMNYFKKEKGYWLMLRGASTISVDDDEFIEVPGLFTF